MNPSIAKKTQETLGKVIKKPPLTDKLLSKPPFRFLHDIITEVMKNTGLLKGLYTTDEMNSANVKEKDAKIAFLQKAIDVVAIVNGVTLSVRPSKVVAGHEPEKTNEFLQELAKAITAKRNSTEAVQTILSGGKPGKSSGDSKRKERSKSRDREISKEKESDKKPDSGSANKENKRKESSHGSADEKKRRDESRVKEDSGRREDSAKRGRERERKNGLEKEKVKEIPKEKTIQKEKEADGGDAVDSGLIDGNLEENDPQQNRIPRPSSAKGQRRRHGDGDGEDSQVAENDGLIGTDSTPVSKEQMNGVLHEDELPPQVVQSRRMARPSSARPAPPKIKKQQEELEEQNARIGSGKEVTSVIVDDGKDDDDNDETFVVEEPHALANDIDAVPSNESMEDESGHGGLVRKILETTKELEGSKEQTSKSTPEKSIINDAARKKERELAQKEIEKLRGSIQTLTRSANPLGKIMDYIQEDVDSMNKELEMWRTENRDHSIALKREQSITDDEIEPLKSQLGELESEITEMVDRISTVKCNILKNEEKIHKMLSSISFNSR